MASLVLFWYKLVKSGNKTIEEVPSKYREEVRYLLEEEEK